MDALKNFAQISNNSTSKRVRRINLSQRGVRTALYSEENSENDLAQPTDKKQFKLPGLVLKKQEIKFVKKQ